MFAKIIYASLYSQNGDNYPLFTEYERCLAQLAT